MAAATVLIPNEIRGVVSGVFAAISGLVASGVAPLLVSGAAQAFGLGGDIALPLAVVGCATSVVGSVAFILSLRAARRARPPGDEPSAAPHPRPSTAIAS